MATYFADKAVQDTRGDRGTTTGRKGTRTVRGCEGAWIAQVKEELAAAGKLPPKPEYPPLGVVVRMFRVDVDWHPTGHRCCEYGVNGWVFDATQEGAEESARAKYAEQVTAHPGVRVSLTKQSQETYLPPRKRRPRQRYVWETLAEAK